MSIESNKALLRRWVDEVVNGHDLDLVDELADADYVGIGGTRKGYKEQAKAVRDSIPDFHHTVEELVAEGDKVWVRYTLRGTHTGGAFLGLPATGKQFEVENVCIYRITDGKIAESWGIVNMFGLCRQLGVIPSFEDLIEQAKSKQE